MKRLFLGKPHASIEAWIKNTPYVPPEPVVEDQFDILYKVEGSDEWQSYAPTENDIEEINGIVTLVCNDFRENVVKPNNVVEVKLPNKWNNGSEDFDVTSIGEGAFYYCTTLTGVTISNRIISIMDHAFGYCNGLTNMVIPNGVTYIGKASFFTCSNLTHITIPNSVTSIGNIAFDRCNDSLFDKNSIPGVILVDGWAVGYVDEELSNDPNLDLSNIRGIAN